MAFRPPEKIMTQAATNAQMQERALERHGKALNITTQGRPAFAICMA